MTTYVGLDCSLTATGVAVLVPGKAPEVAVFGSKPQGPSLRDRSQRLGNLVLKVTNFVFTRVDGPMRVAIEAPPYGKTMNQGSAHDRASLWWQMADVFIRADAPVTEVSPTSLKLFGFLRGSAPAGQDGKALMMARAAQEMPGVDFVDDNGCDALWLALMAQAHGEPGPLVELHLARQKALKGVAWA